MKYTIRPTSKFQKDLKRAQKRGYNIKLSNGESLPLKNRDHNLLGIIVIVKNVILHQIGC